MVQKIDQVNTKNTGSGEIEIDLGEIFGLILHRLWLIILIGIITGSAGYLISTYLITPVYDSTTSVYILNKNESNTITYNDTQVATQLTKDYEELVKSRTVLVSVISNLQLEEDYKSLYEKVKVKNATDTRIIGITVTEKDPRLAQKIANNIRNVATDQIKDVMDIEAVNVVDEANLPTKPAAPSIIKWTVFGGLLGMILIGFILILQYIMDDSIMDSDDIEKYLGQTTLALIPIIEEEDESREKRSIFRKERRRSREEEDSNIVEEKSFDRDPLLEKENDDIGEYDKEIIESESNPFTNHDSDLSALTRLNKVEKNERMNYTGPIPKVITNEEALSEALNTPKGTNTGMTAQDMLRSNHMIRHEEPKRQLTVPKRASVQEIARQMQMDRAKQNSMRKPSAMGMNQSMATNPQRTASEMMGNAMINSNPQRSGNSMPQSAMQRMGNGMPQSAMQRTGNGMSGSIPQRMGNGMPIGAQRQQMSSNAPRQVVNGQSVYIKNGANKQRISAATTRDLMRSH